MKLIKDVKNEWEKACVSDTRKSWEFSDNWILKHKIIPSLK